MKTRTRIFALTVTLCAVVTACTSGGGGGGGGGGTSTTGDDGGAGSGSGSGSGPCKTAGDECDECIERASKVCNAGPCRQEDIDLQNCAVMAVYYPCEDPTTGAPTDCCKLEERLLVDCWNQRCPEMQTCM